ncbi:MAG: ABC transporter permease [Bacteroidota bacterium]
MQRVIFNFILALEGVFSNKLRAFLTALGIIFGVAAVIAMLAIGNGAKQSILEQMKLIGTNNIVIKSVVPTGEEEEVSANAGQGGQRPWSPGLTIEDVQSIQQIVPTIEALSPEIVLSTPIIQSGKLIRAKCVGATNAFFQLNNLRLGKGRYFHQLHMEGGKPVCIIGKTIQNKFFNEEDPIGKKIKCGKTWLTIIGVLEKRIASKESLSNLGIRDYNSDVYVPISTALLRFKNRAYVSSADLADESDFDDEESTGIVVENYHQLDRLVLRVKDSGTLQSSADLVGRMLKRRHQEVIDYEIEVPELLLQQQQKTQETFNLVLAVIAGISLLVGGIGIMNIMLASVLERIKEIGVRRSLGAHRQDIVFQFLFEAVFISLIGGIIGIFLGISAAEAIASSADIPTIVSSWSIVLSFGVAASVGLIFGLFPARKAALQDPIKALRSD